MRKKNKAELTAFVTRYRQAPPLFKNKVAPKDLSEPNFIVSNNSMGLIHLISRALIGGFCGEILSDPLIILKNQN